MLAIYVLAHVSSCVRLTIRLTVRRDSNSELSEISRDCASSARSCELSATALAGRSFAQHGGVGRPRRARGVARPRRARGVARRLSPSSRLGARPMQSPRRAARPCSTRRLPSKLHWKSDGEREKALLDEQARSLVDHEAQMAKLKPDATVVHFEYVSKDAAYARTKAGMQGRAE